jgi:hypothetical protein
VAFDIAEDFFACVSRGDPSWTVWRWNEAAKRSSSVQKRGATST